MTLQELMAKKPDEIERALVKALAESGRTRNGREWFTPVGISVNLISIVARGANACGQAQIAGVCALLYGMIDIFGFSGSIRLAFAARNEMIRKSQQSKGEQNAEGTTTNTVHS